MTVTVARKEASDRQKDLVAKLNPVLTAIGVKDPVKSAWHASGAIGRAANPDGKMIAMLDLLNARPFYARSSREAEWQVFVLKQLKSLRETGTEAAKDAFIKAIADQFEKRTQQ
jgi:hypothetical protein